MLQNAYFLAKIGADTAEIEQHFAEILPKIGKTTLRAVRGQPRGPGGAGRHAAKLAGRERLEPVGDEEAHAALEAAARDLQVGHIPEAKLGGDKVPGVG